MAGALLALTITATAQLPDARQEGPLPSLAPLVERVPPGQVLALGVGKVDERRPDRGQAASVSAAERIAFRKRSPYFSSFAGPTPRTSPSAATVRGRRTAISASVRSGNTT